MNYSSQYFIFMNHIQSYFLELKVIFTFHMYITIQVVVLIYCIVRYYHKLPRFFFFNLKWNYIGII